MQTSRQLLNVNSQAITWLEMQVIQLATAIDKRVKGIFPSQLITNQKMLN